MQRLLDAGTEALTSGIAVEAMMLGDTVESAEHVTSSVLDSEDEHVDDESSLSESASSTRDTFCKKIILKIRPISSAVRIEVMLSVI